MWVLLFFIVDVELSYICSKMVVSGLSFVLQVDGVVFSFELDLFGKNQSLLCVVCEIWFVSEFIVQNIWLMMIVDLIIVWVMLVMDNSNLVLVQQIMDSVVNLCNIVVCQMVVGIVLVGDVSLVESVYQQVCVSVISYCMLVVQDKNVINLLVGEIVLESLLFGIFESFGDNSIVLVLVGVLLLVLLCWLDIQEVEYNLKSVNVDIGVVWVNFFLLIFLIVSVGVGSDLLLLLFSYGMQVWLFVFFISLLLFIGGSNLLQLCYVEVEKKGLIVIYEKLIQSVFKDVVDVLVCWEMLSEEFDVQWQYVVVEQILLDIVMKSYQVGVGDYLLVFIVQCMLWLVKMMLLFLQQIDFNNWIIFWQLLGGGVS